MSDVELERGDIIQLDPEHHTHHDGFWAGQLMMVDEVKGWGVTCFCKVEGGEAHYRAKSGTFERIGRAAWIPDDV